MEPVVKQQTPPLKPPLDAFKEFGSKRKLQGTTWGKILVVIAVTMSLFQFYIAWTNGMTPLLLRAVHLAFATTLIFILYPASKRSPQKRISVLDGVAILAVWTTTIYLIYSFKHFASRAGDPNQLDVILGIVAIVLTLEITRRTTGWILTSLGSFFLLYAYFGQQMPGLLAHRGFDVAKISSFMYTTTDGLFGLTLGVSATYIFFFILFGAFLDSMGAGKFFIDFAYAMTGRRKGGPAQTVVLANGLMSMISGVPAADVVTIGAFTFPLLNKLGYDRTFTAALSAVASTGAMIAPPVMGSAAFLMAEMTGLSYKEICYAAAIPALLYYIALFAITHFYASRYGLQAAKAEDLPNIKQVFKDGWYNIIPIGVLIYFLIVVGYSPMLAGFYSVISLLIVVVINIVLTGSSRDRFREFGKNILKAMKGAAIGSLPVVATCAAAGFLVGVLNITGLGLKFTSILIAWSQGHLFLALIFAAIASLILGMGLPVAACYVILAVLVAPTLVQMGLTPMAANLFVLFFGAFSAITPPVAIAAYAAAAMQNVDPVKVGLRACWLAVPAFLIPFIFAYGPPLLMIGSIPEIIWAFITAIIGVVGLAAGLIGWLIGPTDILQRLMLIVGATMLIVPGIFTDIIGSILIILVVIWQRFQKSQPKKLAVVG